DGDLTEFVVHPVLLDACLQVAGAAAAVGEGRTWLPVGIERLQVHGRMGRSGTCHARCRDAGERTRTLDVQVVRADGAAALIVEGLQLLAADANVLVPASGAGLLHSIQWQRRPRAGGRAVDGMFVVAAPAASPDADALAGALAATGVAAATKHLGTPGAGDATGVVDARAAGDLAAGGLAHLLAAFAPAALGGAAARPGRGLCVRTAGSVAADVLDPLPSPAGAALLAAARALALEHPELQVRAIDVDARTGAREIAAELRQHDGEEQVALR